MVGSNHPTRRGPTSSADLTDRLPGYYREVPGALSSLLESVSLTLQVFQDDFALLEGRLDGWKDPGRRRLLEFLDPELAAPGRFEAAPGGELATHGALREWLVRQGENGGEPVLFWPRLRLESARPAGLRVRTVTEGRSLVVVWPGESGAPEGAGKERIPAKPPVGACPVGLEVQFARVIDPPENPRVEGMRLEGEILGAWV